MTEIKHFIKIKFSYISQPSFKAHFALTRAVILIKYFILAPKAIKKRIFDDLYVLYKVIRE